MKIYISPSTQDKNAGINGYGIEETRMNQLADFVVPMLQAQGHTVYRNRPEMTLAQVCQDSNAKIGSDGLHVALHTNAGGGKGTEIWHHPNSTKGKKLAQDLYEFVAPETASPDRGIKTSTKLMELNTPKSPSVIIEYVFHDNAEDVADFLQPGEMERLAFATVKGICKTAGSPVAESMKPPKTVTTIELTSPTVSEKTIDQLAREVIDGKHGSGEARKKSLGSKYNVVQARVNELLGAKPKPAEKTISQLADEVIRGMHGSGRERQISLGSKYSAVQAEVNRRMRQR